MSTRPTLAERLRSLRSARGLEKQDVFESIKVEGRTYRSWELGTTQPRAEMVAALADFFGVSADYLLGRRDNEAGLEPGKWIVHSGAYQQALACGSDEDIPWAAEIPSEPRLVDRDTLLSMRKAIRKP